MRPRNPSVMKLSDAVRLGGSLDGVDWYRSAHCGVGKALQAAGVSVQDIRASEWDTLFRDLWPWTETVTALRCPHCVKLGNALGNDTYDRRRRGSSNLVAITIECLSRPSIQSEWPIDRIADFVATLEPHESTTEPSHVKSARVTEVPDAP